MLERSLISLILFARIMNKYWCIARKTCGKKFVKEGDVSGSKMAQKEDLINVHTLEGKIT